MIKKNRFITLFFSLLLILAISKICYAQENVDIKASAQASLKNFTESLSSDKTKLNISENENISDMQLGNGYKYASININSVRNIKQPNNSCKLNAILSTNNNYLFPVKLNNRQIAIAYVSYYKNKWQVVQLSSNSSLDSNIKQAEAKYSIKDNDITLIHNEDIQIWAISTSIDSSKEIIPLNDNSKLGLKKYVKLSVNDLIKNINHNFRTNPNSTQNGVSRGSSIGTNNTNNLSKYLISFLLIIIVLSTILIYKIRIHNKAI